MEPQSPDRPDSAADAPCTAPRRQPRTSAPAWLWLLTLGGLSFIFWRFLPETADPVLYSPWFLDQVEAGTIESISIQGLEVNGVVRPTEQGQAAGGARGPRGRRFLTHFPSERSIEPVIRRLRERSPPHHPVRIETHPPREGGMIRLVLLLQAGALLAIVVMMASLRSSRR